MECMLTVLCVCVPAPSPPPVRDDSLNRLVAAAVASQKRIDRLLCDAYLYGPRDGQPGKTLRVVHAAGQDRRFLEVIHGASPSLPAWHDPFRNRSWRDPQKAVMYKLFGRHAYYWNPSEDDLDNLLYGKCIGWRQPGEVALRHLAAGRRLALIDVFARDQWSGLRLLPGPEVWAGLTCRIVVADGGRDRLWICPDRGHALVHRVVQPGDANGMVGEFTCSDFGEVAPGLWLPKTCACVYRPAAGGGPSRSFRLEVVRVLVNRDVPDEVFEPRFLPGTHVFGTSGALESSVPGGTDLFDLWVAELVTYFPRVGPRSGEPSRAGSVLCTFGTVLLVLGAEFWLGPARPGGRESAGRRGPRSGCGAISGKVRAT